MRAAIIVVLSALALECGAQFSQTSFATPMAAGVASGGPYSMQISTGEFGAASEASGGVYRMFSGFIPGTSIVFSFALELDKAILETLFSETGGTLWVNNAGWTSDPNMANWFGVTIENQRVTQLLLPTNNLTGVLPSDISGLTALTVLNVSDNKLIGVPDLNLLPALTSADLRNNKLDFDQLIPNQSVALINPQGPIGLASADTLFVGTSTTLDAASVFAELGNAYQWQLNGVDIAGATDATYEVTSIDYEKMGVYKVAATNAAIPGLTLLSDTLRVMAKGNLTLQIRDFSQNALGSGTSYLMELSEQVGAFDTTNTAPVVTGVATIPNVVLGNYLASVVVDNTNFIPSYYQATFLWEEADQLEMRALNQEAQILVTEKPRDLTPADGTGVIGGILEIDVPDDARIEARRRVAGTRCHIRRRVTGGRDLELNEDTYVLVASVTTDDNGEFRIQFMPAGFYRINFEFPGVPMDNSSFVEFEISEAQNELTLAATITDAGIVVERIQALGIRAPFIENLKVYPNPVTDAIQFDILQTQGVNSLRLYVVSSSGAFVGKPDVQHDSKTASGTFDFSRLPSGVYYLVIESSDQKMRYGHRIVKE